MQKQYVNAYRSLQKLAEQNEALAAPLKNACMSLVAQSAKKYNIVQLGSYIEPRDERNTNLEIKLSQGISNLKHFQNPKQVAANSKSDKIVRKGQFAYNRATTRNGEKISIAYRDGEDCTVSSAYQVFVIKDMSVLNPYFLLLWFSRPEFDRYARYKSEGSAHEFFDYSAMELSLIHILPAHRASTPPTHLCLNHLVECLKCLWLLALSKIDAGLCQKQRWVGGVDARCAGKHAESLIVVFACAIVLNRCV